MKFITDENSVPTAEHFFVDRITPRQEFWNTFERMSKAPFDEPAVIAYYGVGGIGKSSLCGQLRTELTEKAPDAKYAELDFDFIERREPYRILAFLRKKLAKSYGCSFPLFDVIYYTFMVKIGEDMTKPAAKALISSSPVLSFLVDTATFVPGASASLSIISLIDKGVALMRNTFDSDKKLISQLNGFTAAKLLEQMPVYFAKDLAAFTAKEAKPLVIFIDTYEKLVNEMAAVGEPLKNDMWLRSANGLIQRVPNTIWVIGSREKLKWTQLDGEEHWKGVLNQYLIGALSDADSDSYLELAGIGSAEARSKLLKQSDGMPIMLDLSVEQYFRDGTTEMSLMPSVLYERIVRYMDDSEKNLVFMLACLGTWDEELAHRAGKALSMDFSPAFYEKLCTFSFVQTWDGVNYTMMKQVARVLVEHCPARFRQACLALMQSGDDVDENESMEAACAAINAPEPAADEPQSVEETGIHMELLENIDTKDILNAADPRRFVELAVMSLDMAADLYFWFTMCYAPAALEMIDRMQIETYLETVSIVKQCIDVDNGCDTSFLDPVFKLLDAEKNRMIEQHINTAAEYDAAINGLMDNEYPVTLFAVPVINFKQEVCLQNLFKKYEDTFKRYCESGLVSDGDSARDFALLTASQINEYLEFYPKESNDASYWKKFVETNGEPAPDAAETADGHHYVDEREEAVKPYFLAMDAAQTAYLNGETDGDVTEYISKIREAMPICKDVYGEYSEMYLQLAGPLSANLPNDDEEKEYWSQRAYEIALKVYGEDSPSTIQLKQIYARDSLYLGNWDEKYLEMLDDTCKKTEEIFGENSLEAFQNRVEKHIVDWRGVTREEFVDRALDDILAYQKGAVPEDERLDAAIKQVFERMKELAKSDNLDKAADPEWILLYDGDEENDDESGEESADEAEAEAASADNDGDGYHYTKSSDEWFAEANAKFFGVYTRQKLPPKKVKNAVKSYAGSVNEQDIRALMDSTTFGSAKEGFIVTGDSLYLSAYPNKPLAIDNIATLQYADLYLLLTDEAGNNYKQFCPLIEKYFTPLVEALLALVYEES